MEERKRTIAERFAALDADKQKTFLTALKQQGIEFGQLPIVALPGTGRSALSHAQARLWFLWQLAPDSAAYNMASALRMRGDLNLAVLRSSFKALLARHQSLRTVFVPDEQGMAEQVILPAVDIDIPLIDLSASMQGEHKHDRHLEARTSDEITRLGQAPFDLMAGPLLRVVVIRLSLQEHVLAVVMHHIVSDGWSMQVIIKEFAALYSAGVRGDEASLPPLPVQYSDYAAWQRNWLEAGEKDRLLSHWRERLGGDHSALQLPTDHARLATVTHPAQRHAFALPDTLSQAIRQRAQAQGSTVFVLMLAGLQALLYRYTGQQDIRIGMLVANRDRVETEGLVGFFVNTQVLSGQVDGRMPGEVLMAQAQEATLQAQAHQALPFDMLAEALQADRGLARAPLFQVMINHQRKDLRALDQLPSLSLQEQAADGHALQAQFELTLETTEYPDGRIGGLFKYASDLFEPETMDRMASHYQRLLKALADDPAQALGEVSLLGVDEQAQLSAWGVNPAWSGHLDPMHVLIERQASLQHDAVAVILGASRLSYGELNTQANRLAHHLIQLGVGPETKVGVMLERSLDLVVALLAVMKAGGAYVPLDPAYPEDRLALMIDDSAMALLITDSLMALRLAGLALPRTLTLDQLSLGEVSTNDPDVPLHKDSLAYVIYTSGSTGRPKGVGVAHGPLSMHCQQTATLYEMGPESRELHFLSFSFDGAHERWLTALGCGASLVLRDAELWTAAQTHQAMADQQVSNAGFPPAYLTQLADWAREGGQPAPVKLYSFGGEAMPREGFDAVRQHLKPEMLINGYGPTEAVVTPLVWKVSADQSFEQAYAPIGRPVGDRKALVLDANLNLVPQGVAGELYLGGLGLARGYLNRSAMTAERFVPDPFDDQGGRLYRTGDLVRWRADGQVEYLGRLDHQVKIRGFRIELGEVESQLLAIDEIKEAIVVASPGPSGTRLVAYVAARGPAQTLDTAQLKVGLSQTLPDYMVPSVIVQMAQLPVNANGKVDRKALPEPQAQAQAHHEAPQGDIEQALAEVWAQVLGLPLSNISRHDNFFELGGHSLLALQVLVRIHDRFGVRSLALSAIFSATTLSALAAQVNCHDAHEIETIVLASPRDQGVPLYCLPGLLVNSTEYGALVASLAGTRRVCGFVSHALTSRRWRGASVKELATAYADHIRRTVQGSHCALLGWSFGGDIAFETARQLAGQVEVVFMGLIDVTCEQPLASAQALTAASRLEAQQVTQDWLSRSAMKTHWQQLFARLSAEQQDAIHEYILARRHQLPLDGPGLDSQEFREWALLDMKLVRSAYQHGYIDVPTHVWLAEHSMRNEVLRDWAPHAPVMAQHIVPGANHMNIVRAPGFVDAVARTLADIDAA